MKGGRRGERAHWYISQKLNNKKRLEPFILQGTNYSLLILIIITEYELRSPATQRQTMTQPHLLTPHTPNLVTAAGFCGCCSSSELSPALSESVSSLQWQRSGTFLVLSLMDTWWITGSSQKKKKKANSAQLYNLVGVPQICFPGLCKLELDC